MIRFALFFLLGDLAVQTLSDLPDRFQLVLILLLALFASAMRHWSVVAFCAGFGWTVIIAQSVLDDRLAQVLEGRVLTIQGVVADMPMRTDDKVRFDFTPLDGPAGMPEKIRLSWYYPKKLVKAGQLWRFTVKLKRPHGYFNPGGVDYEKWLFSRRIGATGYVKNHPEPELLGRSSNRLLHWRQMIAERMDALSHQPLTRGIVKALSIGDRSDISPAQWTVFRRTGTAHLIAISGLHIGLIAGLVYFLSLQGLLWLPHRKASPRFVAISVSLAAALLYAALAGFSLPTRRALSMLIIVMLALGWRRHVRKSYIVALAVLLILMGDPLAVLSAGFWLSFLAVIVILLTLSGRIQKEPFYRSALRVHIVVALGLLPVLALFFQQFSLLAPLANIIAVPVITLVVIPLVFAVLVVMFFWPAMAHLLITGLDVILQILWRYLQGLSRINWSVYEIHDVSMATLAFAMMGVGLFLLPRGTPVRYLGVFMLLPLFYPVDQRLPEGEARLVLLDVGQGLAMVVESRNHAMIFDAGARYNENSDKGKSVVLPYLQSRGIHKLDGVIVSHGDNDHIGGVFSVLRAMPYSRVLSSVPEKLSAFKAEFCQAGQQWRWDGVTFSLLSPPVGQTLGSENNRSCVLLIESRQFRFLLPGDIEQEAENWLIEQYGENLRVDVLIAPHHGSKTSSSDGFLQQLAPGYILIPAGYRNRFGFPHTVVLQRYQRREIDWLTTAAAGAIIMQTNKKRLIITASRIKAGRYWLKAM